MTCSYETERIAEDRDRLAHNPEVAVYFAWCSSARSNGASPTHSSKASTAGSAGCENEPESCSGHILFGTSGAPELLRRGVAVEVAAQLLGHASIAPTGTPLHT